MIFRSPGTVCRTRNVAIPNPAPTATPDDRELGSERIGEPPEHIVGVEGPQAGMPGTVHRTLTSAPARAWSCRGADVADLSLQLALEEADGHAASFLQFAQLMSNQKPVDKNKWMIDPNDAVLLLIDHQSGLFQLVRDIDEPVLRAHVRALARVARLAEIPTFTTASVPDGPNGPLIPEIHELNPDAVYIPRSGQINAWDNPAWVKAIEGTKRKTLLIAGTLTSVCMSFPSLSALVAGYKVFTIVDASGNWSQMATDITLARVVQAGAMPIDTYAVLAEVMSTWNRPDAMDFARIMVDEIVPPYRALMESYDKAQTVQKVGHETKLDRLTHAPVGPV